MIGRVLWDEFFSNNDWPMASSVAVVMILLIIVPLAHLQPLPGAGAGGTRERRQSSARRSRAVFKAWLIGGYCVPVPPIVALVIYSLQRLADPEPWAGFTLKLVCGAAQRPRDDRRPLAQLRRSPSSPPAVGGCWARWPLRARQVPRFTGRTPSAGMVNAPLVMPEVIIGLSLLLMLVSVQRAGRLPERGMLTIWIGHLLLGMAYATVVVQARLGT